jgi:hypothetical protein
MRRMGAGVVATRFRLHLPLAIRRRKRLVRVGCSRCRCCCARPMLLVLLVLKLWLLLLLLRHGGGLACDGNPKIRNVRFPNFHGFQPFAHNVILVGMTALLAHGAFQGHGGTLVKPVPADLAVQTHQILWFRSFTLIL